MTKAGTKEGKRERRTLDWYDILSTAKESGLTSADLCRKHKLYPAQVRKASIKYGITLPVTRGYEKRLEVARKTTQERGGGDTIPDYYGPKEHPLLPRLGASGGYLPDDLLRFLRQCEVQGLRVDQIAALLRVPIHRVVYLINGGKDVLRKCVGAKV